MVRTGVMPLPDAVRRPFLLSVGRLEYQKGHDTLLRAFAASRARHTHDLFILGEGSLETELRGLARDLGIADRVRLTGFLANPYAWMAEADLFVMPSRWEGFPNAAAEAAAAGAAMLLADCPYGPREIVQDGYTGTLFPVDDGAALAAQIDRLLADPQARARHGFAAQLRVRRFGIDRIAGQYADLIATVAEPVAQQEPRLTFAASAVPVRDAAI